jgi:hypothetical protein
MRQIVACLCVLGGILASSTSTYAFNGNRSGFILGGGGGLSISSYTQTLNVSHLGSGTSDRETKTGFATDFKIGGGINDQLLLYYEDKTSWFSMDNALGKSVTIANSVGLLGASYYMQPKAPCGYFTGLLGVASWSAPFEEGDSSQSGVGVAIGAGYEFAPHWSVEASLAVGSPNKSVGGVKVTTNAMAFHVTINGLAY